MGRVLIALLNFAVKRLCQKLFFKSTSEKSNFVLFVQACANA
jgi:hypothetical protein